MIYKPPPQSRKHPKNKAKKSSLGTLRLLIFRSNEQISVKTAQMLSEFLEKFQNFTFAKSGKSPASFLSCHESLLKTTYELICVTCPYIFLIAI